MVRSRPFGTDFAQRLRLSRSGAKLARLALARRLHRHEPMAVMRVTCPELGHLQTIDIERRGRHLVVLRCSEFGDCLLSCEQTCAARLTARFTAPKAIDPGTVLVARSCLAR